MKPVVIIGGGLAGLACARTLSEKGIACVLIEAKSKLGGRVASYHTSGGFLIDEGFQVLLDSYPELRNFVSIKSLHLHNFNSGALIFNGEGMDLLVNPFRHPKKCFKTVTFPYATWRDKVLVVKLMVFSQFFKNDDVMGEESTLSFLKRFGFSQTFVDSFWQPFLTGVYLDPDLTIGSKYFQFLLRCFAWGQVCLPDLGMEQLPIHIAANLTPSSLRLNCPVESWSQNEVILESGEKIEASRVVCAFGSTSSREAEVKQFRAVTTHYFTSSLLTQLGWEKWLILVPKKFGLSITHLALLSSVAPNYSNNHQPLLSVSCVGVHNKEALLIAKEVEKIAGKPLELEWIDTRIINKALPVIEGQPSGFEIKAGVIYCGDRQASPSINGALKSGRLAAEYILKDSATQKHPKGSF